MANRSLKSGGITRLADIARRIADNPHFQHFILGIIVVGAIVIGVETSATLTARYSGLILAIEMLIQTIFVTEIAIRLFAYWPRPAAFFKSGWNVYSTSSSWRLLCSHRPARSPWSLGSRD
jgi:hypothetical protein